MKNYFKRLPMRIKLIVSFSGPMILIFILLLSCSYMLIEKRYEAQIIYSADQSFEQAVNFLESHLQNMNYIWSLWVRIGSCRTAGGGKLPYQTGSGRSVEGLLEDNVL